MDTFLVNIPLSIFISFVFSILIFFYLNTFKVEETYLRIYKHLFLTFVFSGFYLILYRNNLYSESFILASSFIIFLTFMFFSYREYKSNLDFFNFILISFYLFNFLFYYLLIKYPNIFLGFSKSYILNYLIIFLSIGLITYHQIKKPGNKLVFFSYFLLLFYYIIISLNPNPLKYWLSLFFLSTFFILHTVNMKKQVYDPLISKLEKLTIQINRRNAELPEHIRDKFQIMEHNKAKLMNMAYTDKMTGVLNKDKISSQIKELINDPRVPVFSIMMFDIDDFKLINDTKGHLVGDECLINLTKIGYESIRKNDFIGRYGGDEFLFLLSGLDAYETKIIAERFRLKIDKETNPHFTISVGVASYPEDGKTFKELIENADKALYLSKEKGKNKVSHIRLY